MVLLLLAACLITDDDLAARQDADEDGHLAATFGGDDCDDDDPSVHPGATELCDSVDWDCDGRTGLEDDDGDGSPACADCDDDDAGVHPGAIEGCSPADVDDDCDGLVDHDDPDLVGTVTLYRDGDADSHGDPSASTQACGSLPGWVDDLSDCDDADARVPAAGETCFDGVDNDCDGEVDVCPTLDLDDHVVARSATSWEALGFAVDLAHDLDGDGLDDLVFSQPYTAGYDGAFALFGPVEAIADLDEADLVVEGDAGGFPVPTFVVTEDLTGDGSVDLLLASPNLSGGTVTLLPGPLTGHIELSTETRYLLIAAEVGDRAGTALATADLTGDGQRDLLVGAPDAYGGQGGVIVVAGPITGSSSLADANLAVVGVGSLKYVGSTLAGAADLDGDGAEDALMGAASSMGGRGVVALLSSAELTGLAGEVDVDVLPYIIGGTDDNLGEDFGLGDLDGDGGAEVAVLAGHPEENGNGVVYLLDQEVFADRGTVADSYGRIEPWPGANLTTLDRAGDVDGDGVEDLIVGGSRDGRLAAWLVHGGISGTVTVEDLNETALDTWGQNLTSEDEVGVSGELRVAGGGDVDGDGVPDLAFGAPSGSPYPWVALWRGWEGAW